MGVSQPAWGEMGGGELADRQQPGRCVELQESRAGAATSSLGRLELRLPERQQLKETLGA